MKTIRYELNEGIATLTFDEPDSPVNTMCAQWQADLAEATPVDAMTLDARPLASRVLDNACRLFTPIL